MLIKGAEELASPSARAISDEWVREETVWAAAHCEKRTRPCVSVLCCVRREASSGCAARPRNRLFIARARFQIQHHTKKIKVL